MIGILIAIIAVVAILLIIEMIREQHIFEVTEYTFAQGEVQGLKSDVKMLFLSDLHNHEYGEGNADLLVKIKEQSPDVILIGGDLLVGKRGHEQVVALSLVKNLVEIAPVYYANGNHEQRMKERVKYHGDKYKNYKKKLLELGVHMLENETAVFDIHGARFLVSGLEIPLYGYGHFKKVNLSLPEVEKNFKRPDGEGYRIMMAHNPSYVKQYKQMGMDLILCGHLHGGLVRVPGVGGVISPDLCIFPKYSGGRYAEENGQVVVSRGLGTHTINIRLFNKAELVVLSFLADKACENKENLV